MVTVLTRPVQAQARQKPVLGEGKQTLTLTSKEGLFAIDAFWERESTFLSNGISLGYQPQSLVE